MPIKKVKKYIELPLEVEKTYMTKFSTGERFLLKKIKYDGKGRLVGFDGIYESCPHLGICPLGAGRLIPERMVDGEMDVCSRCGTEI